MMNSDPMMLQFSQAPPSGALMQTNEKVWGLLPVSAVDTFVRTKPQARAGQTALPETVHGHRNATKPKGTGLLYDILLT